MIINGQMDMTVKQTEQGMRFPGAFLPPTRNYIISANITSLLDGWFSVWVFGVPSLCSDAVLLVKLPFILLQTVVVSLVNSSKYVASVLWM